MAAHLDLRQVIPYLKAVLRSATPDAVIGLGENDSVVSRPFVGRLITTYVVDAGDRFEFVSQRRLASTGHTADQLHHHALRNLARRVNTGEVQVAQRRSSTAVLLDGNLEATLMLLDQFCDQLAEHLGADELLAAAPARDILAVCPARDPAGRAELTELVERVSAGGDHLLNQDFYRWHAHHWRLAEVP